MISIIVPTYNESKNLTRLVPELYKILRGLKVKFEILIVDDDSPDKTWQVAKKYSAYNVKVIRRKGDRGLSSAVIEGFNKAKGEIFIVMDADLSHPPKLIPKMLNASRNHDLVLASRYIGSGRAKFSLYRKLVSFGAKLLNRLT